MLDLCVREMNSDIQPLGGGYIASDDSPLELCCRDMNSEVWQPGGSCMVLNGSSFIPYYRSVKQFSHPMVEKINCTRVSGCAGNGHSPWVSKNETTSAEIVRSTELCARKEVRAKPKPCARNDSFPNRHDMLGKLCVYKD